jgi:DNA-directed RNA polymerase subunit RPC12/RpoP
LCCGSEMKAEQTLEKSTIYRCTNCGLSDTKLNC